MNNLWTVNTSTRDSCVVAKFDSGQKWFYSDHGCFLARLDWLGKKGTSRKWTPLKQQANF